jgi:hypothetical protein
MAATMMLGTFSNTAFAYVDENAEATETAVIEETPVETENTPFSTPGNGQLVDDKTDDDSKEFLTIQTKNGNTFYMILDRSSNTDNVYMLSMIDENDLAGFLDEPETEEETETPAVVIPEVTPDATEDAETEVSEPKQEKSTNKMSLLFLGGIFACVAAGLAAFKFLVSKKEEDDSSEQLEFTDEQFINEDYEQKK